MGTIKPATTEGTRKTQSARAVGGHADREAEWPATLPPSPRMPRHRQLGVRRLLAALPAQSSDRYHEAKGDARGIAGGPGGCIDKNLFRMHVPSSPACATFAYP